MTAKPPFLTRASRLQAFRLGVVVVWLGALLLAGHAGLVGDELIHWNQIALFLRGDFQILSAWLTNVPGLHFTLWGLLELAGAEQAFAARWANAGFALAGVLAFWRIRAGVGSDDAGRDAWIFALFPLALPFHFLVYTDTAALTFLLLAVLATLRGKHAWSALALIASMAMRQHHVYWDGLLVLLALSRHPAPALLHLRTWLHLLPYAMPLAVFVAYWFVHGSISFSSAQSEHMHPDFAFSIANPLFLCALAVVILPFHILRGLQRFGGAARTRRAWWCLPLVVFGGGMLFFEVSHPFNRVPGDTYLRNVFLAWAVREPLHLAVFCAMAAAGAAGLSMFRYPHPAWRWCFPIGLLFVAASWLIEGRYAIVPLALLLALRRSEDAGVEEATAWWWLALGAVLVIGVFDGRFIP